MSLCLSFMFALMEARKSHTLYTSVCLRTLQPLEGWLQIFSLGHTVGHLQANVWLLALCV